LIFKIIGIILTKTVNRKMLIVNLIINLCNFLQLIFKILATSIFFYSNTDHQQMLKETKTVYLSDCYTGQKSFPDWYTKFMSKRKKNFREESFTWEYTTGDVTEHYNCEMSDYTGTLYNQHNRKIGENHLVSFHLKSVLYHCPATEKLHELKQFEDRLLKLRTKINADINAINGSADDEQLAIKLSNLLRTLSEIEIKIEKLKKKIAKTKKRPTDTSGNILVLMIRMNPHKKLNQKLLLQILKMVDVDEDSITALSAVTLSPTEIKALDGCMNLYLPYRVQWTVPTRKFELIKVEIFHPKKARTKTVETVATMPQSTKVCCLSDLARTAQHVPIRREAIDDYKIKLHVEAQLRAELDSDNVFCPVQFYYANEVEIEIAKYEVRMGM
jgi:hypothetical protein